MLPASENHYLFTLQQWIVTQTLIQPYQLTFSTESKKKVLNTEMIHDQPKLWTKKYLNTEAPYSQPKTLNNIAKTKNWKFDLLNYPQASQRKPSSENAADIMQHSSLTTNDLDSWQVRTLTRFELSLYPFNKDIFNFINCVSLTFTNTFSLPSLIFIRRPKKYFEQSFIPIFLFHLNLP